MTAFTPRRDILPPAQNLLWPELRNAAALGFVLYGGTAIALRLGHRQSVDFDFFAKRPLDRDAMREALPFLSTATVIQDEPRSFTVLVPFPGEEESHVKISFFGGIHVDRIREPDWTDDGNLLVASLDDLMATKLKVILQRVEAKDYQDVAAMIAAGVNLGTGLSASRQLYGNTFQASEAIKALVYFEGGDLSSLSDSDRQTLIRAATEVRTLFEPRNPMIP
ncbi:MAG: nucleotidyl transferase AbiEii/AbiGii toxin family protein [Ahniella sp.]|nr:nucleotidyl transferase AbiEii/AbiGii toxin family protein [Ahniella sp.]